MDLSKYKLAGETEKHWEVQGPRGTFRIAKQGVSKKTRDMIAQHFAEGGPVEAAAPAIDSQIAATVPGATEPAPGQAEPIPTQVLTGDPEIDAMIAAVPMPRPPGPATLGDRVRGGVKHAVFQGLLGPVVGDALAYASDSAQQAAAERPAVVAAPPVTQEPAGEQPAPQRPLARPVVVMPGVAFPSGTPSGLGGQTQADIDRSYREAEAAAQAQADTAKREADAVVAAQAENEAQRQAAADQWKQTLDDWQKRGDALRQEILAQRIDPNRLWASKSTGGKVGAAIGLILGGIGSSLTGQPNAALKIMSDAIDRDIDAQKANLENKKSLLAFHMQEGHSLQAAYQLTKADLLDAAGAKLQMTASKFAGEKAQANAKGVIAELHRQAALTRQAVAGQNLDLTLKGMQIQATKQAMAIAALEAQRRQQMPQDPLGGLDPKDRERAVVAPDGKVYFLARKEDAEKVQEQVRGYQAVRAGIEDMRRLRKEHGRAFNPWSAASASGDNMREQMIGSLRLAILGPGAITDKERERMEKIVPPPGEVWMTDEAFEAKLRELEQKALDGMWAGLSGSGAAPPRPRIPERKG